MFKVKKIIPHLWFDKEAKEAALFYAGVFPDSSYLDSIIIENTPSGNSEIVRFSLSGIDFEAISAGPYFKFNPSINLLVHCNTESELKSIWKELKEGGMEHMPLGEYPFSKLYSWVQDKYGLNWQLLLNDQGSYAQKIVPSLMFSKDVCGRAQEAIEFYRSVFNDSNLNIISYYNEGEAPNSKAIINYSSMNIQCFEINLMDNAMEADFTFNEAFSIIIRCKDQEEIDYYWSRLSAVPDAEACGWLKDKFGVSWQVVPDNMDDILFGGSKEEIERVTEAFLRMKKFDLDALEIARKG